MKDKALNALQNGVQCIVMAGTHSGKSGRLGICIAVKQSISPSQLSKKWCSL